jgi:hypothetical protein
MGPQSRTFVEFRFPEGERGRDLRLPVSDLGVSGLGFVLEEHLPGLDLGTGIKGATLCHGERKIAMDLLVLHVTEEFASDAVCGCLLYPASDAALREFKDLLDELAHQHVPVIS